jgi:hypothetical protein
VAKPMAKRDAELPLVTRRAPQLELKPGLY